MDREINEEVLHTVKRERNILHTVKLWNTSWICYIVHSNCLLKHAVQGKRSSDKVTGRQGIGRKQLLDELKEVRGYWKLKAEALALPLFGALALEVGVGLSNE
jgi:hypothetical protein